MSANEQRRPRREGGAEIIRLTGSTTSPRYRNRRPGRVKIEPDQEMQARLNAAQQVLSALITGRLEPTVANIDMARMSLDRAAMWAFMKSLGAEVAV